MRIDDARRAGFPRAESFGMDARARSAPVGEIGAERAHECRWTAYIEIGVARNLQRVEARYGQMTGGIEIRPESILGGRSAVPDSTPAMWQAAQLFARLRHKRVVLAIARAVKPPDFPCR